MFVAQRRSLMTKVAKSEAATYGLVSWKCCTYSAAIKPGASSALSGCHGDLAAASSAPNTATSKLLAESSAMPPM
jgi:hypothetical protein